MNYEIIINQSLDYLAYEKIIMNQLYGLWILSSICLLASVICIIYCVFKIRNEKEVLWFIIGIVCLGVFIGNIILIRNATNAALYDIENKAYIVWEGDFVVDSYKSSGNSILCIPDEKGIKLEMDAYTLRGGKYSGKVIYGEKTKYVLEIQVDEVTD